MINRLERAIDDMSANLGRMEVLNVETLIFSPGDYELLSRPADVALTHILGFRVEPHAGVESGVVVAINPQRVIVGAFRLDR